MKYCTERHRVKGPITIKSTVATGMAGTENTLLPMVIELRGMVMEKTMSATEIMENANQAAVGFILSIFTAVVSLRDRQYASSS